MARREQTGRQIGGIDRELMARAIALAQRGQGRVEPNPGVGCVIARNGRIIGEGYHRRFGGPHAEVEALRACKSSPRGATVYVSLEPCSHHGKTPPCTDALINAKVKRVVIGAGDPNPLVKGKGIRTLRKAGIEVQTGVLKAEAEEVLAPYLTRLRLKRPYVIAKWAQSLDGKLATRTGHSQWISCEASRRRVHRLRARVDAILVGSGTVAKDNPRLTARDVPVRRKALRVVLDSRLRTPEKCQLVDTARDHATLIITTRKQAESRKAPRLRKCGAEVLGVRSRNGRVVILDALRALARRDVTNLMVEGGPTILTSFFEVGCVDEAQIYTAPILIGGSTAPGPLLGPGPAKVDTALKPRVVKSVKSGVDMLNVLRFT